MTDRAKPKRLDNAQDVRARKKGIPSTNEIQVISHRGAREARKAIQNKIVPCSPSRARHSMKLPSPATEHEKHGLYYRRIDCASSASNLQPHTRHARLFLPSGRGTGGVVIGIEKTRVTRETTSTSWVGKADNQTSNTQRVHEIHYPT